MGGCSEATAAFLFKVDDFGDGCCCCWFVVVVVVVLFVVGNIANGFRRLLLEHNNSMADVMRALYFVKRFDDEGPPLAFSCRSLCKAHICLTTLATNWNVGKIIFFFWSLHLIIHVFFFVGNYLKKTQTVTRKQFKNKIEQIAKYGKTSNTPICFAMLVEWVFEENWTERKLAKCVVCCPVKYLYFFRFIHIAV